jgi:hypothetical protein
MERETAAGCIAGPRPGPPSPWHLLLQTQCGGGQESHSASQGVDRRLPAPAIPTAPPAISAPQGPEACKKLLCYSFHQRCLAVPRAQRRPTCCMQASSVASMPQLHWMADSLDQAHSSPWRQRWGHQGRGT